MELQHPRWDYMLFTGVQYMHTAEAHNHTTQKTKKKNYRCKEYIRNRNRNRNPALYAHGHSMFQLVLKQKSKICL